MKRQPVRVSRVLIASGTALLLTVLLAASASAQFRFQRGYQQQYRPSAQQQYRPSAQQQYSPYGQQPYQRYQQYPNRFQQPYQQQPYQQPYRPGQPPIFQQPQATSTTTTSGGVTPPSVLRYAIKGSEDYKLYPRLSGEFEKQKAILLSVSDLQYQHNGVLAQMIKKSSGHGVRFIILYNDDKQLESTVELLDSLKCDLAHVSLYRLKLDTIWLRDFGPRFAETKSGAQSIDFYYNGQRPLDDKFPISWGELSDEDVSRIKWTLQGGNMQSNGKGFAFVSSRLFEDNAINLPHAASGTDLEFEKRKLVVDAFKKGCNIDQLLVLEPLRPEATKHVDMFATFVTEDTVVVAEVDPKLDPQNAKILKYNVNLLEQVKVDGKPLKVERIKFPPRNGKYWSPYTNVIMANNLLLMPVYDTDPPAMIESALEVYRRLLPDYHVDTVNMTSMQKLEGALHCMSINVPNYANLPRGIESVKQARAAISKKGYVSKKTKTDLGSNLKTSEVKKSKPSSQLAINGTPERIKPKSKLADKVATYKGSLSTPAGNRKSATPKLAAKSPPKPSPPIVRPGDVAQQQLDKPQVDSQQVAAVMTYRRKFIDNSRQFSVDAYAIGLQSGRVLLRQVGIAKELALPIDRLCDEDKQWLSKNENKIRANGSKVRKFVLANGM